MTSERGGAGEVSVPGSRPLAEALSALPFQRDVIDYLRTDEKDLWTWYSSTGAADEHAKAVRLELLKTTYRLERADHPDWYAMVDAVAPSMGVTAPITLYQSQGAAGLNAFLSYAPGEAHVVFEGPVQATLTPDELRAALAHELTHFLLWEAHGGDLLRADQVLAAMANHPRAEPSHLETARLFRLYLEVHADRGALVVCADPRTAISSLIKVETGLADAQVDSYLKQADEIFSQEDVSTERLTHPEAYIRARALRLWAEQGEAANLEVARMIEGALTLGRLSLLGQRRLTTATRWLLARFLQPAWLRSEARVAHARLYFADLDLEREGGDAVARPGELETMTDSVEDYVSYVLLDMATVDQAVDEPALAASLRMAEDLGLGERFLRVAGRELGLAKRNVARLKKDASAIVARAAADPGGTA